MKDESGRHQSWNIVQFHSVYKSKVNFMIGSVDILKSLGYAEEIYNNMGEITGLSFPTGKTPNQKIILDIAVDLVIAQFEVEAMIMGEHPRANELQTIEDVSCVYFPPKVGYQSNVHLEEKNSVSSSLGSSSSYNSIPPLLPPKRSSESHVQNTAILQERNTSQSSKN